MRFVTVLAVVCLGLVGCTSADEPADANPTSATSAPTSSSAPTTPDPSPAAASVPTAGQLVAMLVRPWNAALSSSAPAGDVSARLRGMVTQATTRDGSARTFLQDRQALAFAPDTRYRGDVRGVPLGGVDVLDGRADVAACTSAAFAATRGDRVGGSSGPWVVHDITAVAVDGDWLLQDVVARTDDDGPVVCAPPARRRQVLEAWAETVRLQEAYFRAPADPEAVAAFAEVVDGPAPELPGRMRLALQDVARDPVIERLDRRSALISWCQDPSLDPEGFGITVDGERTDVQPTASLYPGRLRQGAWLINLSEGTNVPSSDTVSDAANEVFRRCYP